MHARELSAAYIVRPLLTADAARVLPLLRGNTIFYRYHPPEPTLESIVADMTALPPGRTPQDKHYVGFFGRMSCWPCWIWCCTIQARMRR